MLIAALVILMMAARSPASAGPQDDPTIPPVAITPGGGGFLSDDERTYSATLTYAGAVADQILESGQAAQALAAAAAARGAALSDTGSTAAGGSAAPATAGLSASAGERWNGVAVAGVGNPGECGFRAATVPAGDARWGGNDPATGTLLMNPCNGPVQYLFVPDPPPGAPAAPPPPPPPDPAVLAQQAYTELTVPKPEAQRSPPETNSDPDNGGLPYTYVGLQTWVWATNWQPLQRTVDLRGVSATVTATPTALVFDPGNRDAPVTCPGPGRPWTEADGNKSPTGGGCAYMYRAVTPDGPLTASTGITWSVAWTSNTGAGGTFPALSTATTSSFLVEQIQVVVQR
jgi:hypothetical protein